MADHPAHEEALIEAGRRLFAGECRFATAAVDTLPTPRLPEVAFAGRSNVGKSSLLNALAGRRSLARVSHTPGRTQQINFFDLAGRLALVDLPGYGFARAPRAQIAAWTGLVESYLRDRSALRRVVLLVDSRLGLKDSDRHMMGLLDAAAVPYQLVLTKADKMKPAALDAVRDSVAGEAAGRPAAHPAVVAVSARTGQGLPELRAALAVLVDTAPAKSGVEVSP